MDRYTKTGLRLNPSTRPFRPGAARSAPTSTEEEALLFLIEPKPVLPPDTAPLPETPAATRKPSDESKQPEV
jgi:hypothetical protein